MAKDPEIGRFRFSEIVPAFIITLVAGGIYRSQGLFYVEFMKNYGVCRQSALVPFCFQIGLRNLLCPVIGLLSKRYCISTIVVSGAVLGSVCSALCFFTSDVAYFIILWGIINGLSASLLTLLPQILISSHVAKHKNTASNVLLSGSCIASLVFPMVLEIIFLKYHFNNSFLIIAGIIMQTIPSGMMLRRHTESEKTTIVENKNDIKVTVENWTVGDSEYDSTSSNMCERAVQVGNSSKNSDIFTERKPSQNAECRHQAVSRRRSCSYSGLTYQMHLQNLQRFSLFPKMSSIELNYKTFTSNVDHIFDVDIDYLKRKSDLVYQMLSMEIPNVEMSFRAVLLEVEPDELWHPDQDELIQELESMYCHIDRSLEIDNISVAGVRANGLYLKKTFLNGALTASKKSESLRVVKRYIKTYKQRGLQQLGKIRSAPNMSNVYNELAKKDYVISKLKQLYNSNEIRIISHLSMYNPKDVLKILFQLRTLYKVYNDLESCDQCEPTEVCEMGVETGDILTFRADSCTKFDVKSTNESPDEKNILKDSPNPVVYIYKNIIFILLCITRSACVINLHSFITTIYDFALEKGIPEDYGKFLIGILAIGELFGRLCFGWITEKRLLNLPRYIFLCMCLLGICTILVPLACSWWTVFSIIFFFGTFQGLVLIRIPDLITEHLKPLDLSVVLEWMDVPSGLLCLFLPLYIGYIRDNAGNYNPMYYINGAFVIISGITWLFEFQNINNKSKSEAHL